MSSSNPQHNYHKYKDDNELQKWYTMAQTQLEEKMTDNVNKRIINSTKAINDSIKRLIQNTTSNHIWNALFPNKSIDQYTNIFPSFIIPKTLTNNALQTLAQKVNHWAGVDIASMNERPKDFKKYAKTADNWWNRYKSDWLGSFVFQPLLLELETWIIDITQQFTTTSFNKSVTKQDEQSITRQLLFFTILNELLYTEVEFPRAKPQPLILDQSFEKSEILKTFFEQYGIKYSTTQLDASWSIPPNDKRLKKKRFHIRDYARKWTDILLTNKKQMYNKLVMKEECFMIKTPVKPPTPKQNIYNNNYNIPPSIEYNKINNTYMSSVIMNNRLKYFGEITSGMKITNKYVTNINSENINIDQHMNMNNNSCYLHASGFIPKHNDRMPPPPYVTGNNNYKQLQIQQHIRYNQYMNPLVTQIETPIYDDDAQTGSTYSTISNYTRKPRRPFRRRGVSYKANHSNMNMIRPASMYRYNPMKYVHSRRYYNTMRCCNNANTYIDNNNNATISVPGASTMQINESVININDMSNNYMPSIENNNDMPDTFIQNDTSFSTVSIEDNYIPFDQDDQMSFNFHDDNMLFTI